MQFDWYNIFNLTEFEALDLPSRTYTYFFEGLGEKSILVTKGNTVAMTFEGEFLPIDFIEMALHPNETFVSGSKAVYIDDNDDVWLGIEVEE